MKAHSHILLLDAQNVNIGKNVKLLRSAHDHRIRDTNHFVPFCCGLFTSHSLRQHLFTTRPLGQAAASCPVTWACSTVSYPKGRTTKTITSGCYQKLLRTSTKLSSSVMLVWPSSIVYHSTNQYTLKYLKNI